MSRPYGNKIGSTRSIGTKARTFVGKGSSKRPSKAGRDYQSRIEQHQSPTKMLAIPIFSVLIGSILTTLPIITEQPLLPPFGLMIFLTLRLLRPGLWPMWAGLPFGLFDDLFSGQPFGSAGLIWSAAMIAIELLDNRAIWRDLWQDWLIASIIIINALCAGLFFVGLAYGGPGAVVLLPQIALSVLLYPLIVRLCVRLDKWRISP
jgi:rod shape-determining protein MreD